MNDKLIFPIVIHPTATKSERAVSLLLIAFTFLPFIYGIFTQQGIYCLSLVIGVLGIFAFNYFTKYKFTTLKSIQKNNAIVFSKSAVKIVNSEQETSYNWDSLKNIEIQLISYKRRSKDEDNNYEGIENYLLFTLEETDFKHHLYVENQKDFDCLSHYFEATLLPALYDFKTIKKENIIITKLDYLELQDFKTKYNINRYTDFIHFN